MTEVIEYSLVVALSMVMVVFSLGFFGSYSSQISYSEDRADFASISTVAMTSLEHGSSSVTLGLSGAVVACVEGELTFTSPRYNGSASLPTDCDFRTGVLTGVYTLSFVSSGPGTQIEVS
ncbi:MAG TPA: hypothetical protein VEJ36_05125 [Nitrososphaerales archaeon]|nr:hypothetical protein [Nitrososphaerales archaeon]